MSLRIRLTRAGAKKRPFYRIVVTDSRNPRDGRFIERIGSYDPMLQKDNEKRVVLDADRAKYWVGVGAVPSDRVARFLSDVGLTAARGHNEQPKKSAPKKKAQERAKEREEAAAKAAAADAAPAAE